MSITWNTEQQAAEAAKQGVIPALENSLLHHRQGATADWVELRDAIEGKKFAVCNEFCACCLLIDVSCDNCPLTTMPQGLPTERCCNGLWGKVANYFRLLKDGYSNANFRAFQDAEKAVCDYIEAVLEKEKAKECKCSKKSIIEYGDEFIRGGVTEDKDELLYALYIKNPALKNNVIPLVAVNKNGCPCGNISLHDKGIKTGRNIFDDLKRNSEDLERTDVDGFVMEIMGNRICIGGRRFQQHLAIEFHQKLGRLISTAKEDARRQEAKSK